MQRGFRRAAERRACGGVEIHRCAEGVLCLSTGALRMIGGIGLPEFGRSQRRTELPCAVRLLLRRRTGSSWFGPVVEIIHAYPLPDISLGKGP